MSNQVRASRLLKSTEVQLVKNIIQSTTQYIDTKILEAHRLGFNHIRCELPTEFALNNMPLADAQLLIYSELLKLYSDPEDENGRGFDVSLEQPNIMHIRWKNGLSQYDREDRMRIIKKFMVPKAPQ